MTLRGRECAWCHPIGLVILLAMAWAGRLGAVGTNDQFVGATTLFGLTNFTTVNTGATTEAGEPRHAGEPAGSTLWWKWTVPFTGSFSIVTTNSLVTSNVPLDTVVAVYTGSSLSNLALVVANDDTAYGEFGATWSRCVFRAYAGETLMIAVGSLDATGTIRFSLNVAGPYLSPWQAPGLSGEPLSSESFRGQVLMIDFWETICEACIEELPALIRVQTLFSSQGFTFVGLSGDANVADVVAYMASSDINYPIAMGDRLLQTNLTGVAVAYPTKLLVDREGRLVGIYVGGNTEMNYRAILEPLLRTPPSIRAWIARVGRNVTIRWPSSESGWVLESTTQLEGGHWSSVGAMPAMTNGENVVTVPAGASAEFFRLRKP